MRRAFHTDHDKLSHSDGGTSCKPKEGAKSQPQIKSAEMALSTELMPSLGSRCPSPATWLSHHFYDIGRILQLSDSHALLPKPTVSQ